MIRKHQAVLGDAHLTFTWTVSAGELDRVGAVDKLLDSGWAVAASFRAGDVRLPPHVRSWDRTLKDAQGVRDMSELLVDESVELKALLGWARGHPRLAWMFFRPWLTAKARRLITRRPRGEAVNSGAMREQAAAMAAVVDSMVRQVAAIQVPIEIRRFVEHEMLRPAYLARSYPFRLCLDSIRATLEISGKPERVLLDPMVSFYSSGVCVVSIDIPLPRGLTAAEVQDHARTDGIGVSDLWFPAPLKKILADEVRWTGAEDDDFYQVKLRPTEGEPDDENEGPGGTLTDLWHVIHHALGKTTRISFHDEWHSYPTITAIATHCCRTRERWETRHLQEFEDLLLKRPKVKQRDPRALPRPVNSSFDEDTWLWHTAAATLQISWEQERGEISFEDVARVLLVCEIYLVQVATLRLLSDEFVAALKGHGFKHVRRFALRLNLSLEEFDHPALSYLSAQQDVERMLQEAGVGPTQSRLRERTGSVSNMLAIARSERNARRGLWFAGSALIAAVILSLPALVDGITQLRGVPSGSPVLGRLLTPLRTSSAPSATIAVWVLLAALLLLAVPFLWRLLASSTRRAWKRLRRPRKVPGYRWSGGTVKIVAQERAEPTSSARP